MQFDFFSRLASPLYRYAVQGREAASCLDGTLLQRRFRPIGFPDVALFFRPSPALFLPFSNGTILIGSLFNLHVIQYDEDNGIRTSAIRIRCMMGG